MDHAGPLRGSQLVALHQGCGVLVSREAARFANRLFQLALQILWQFLVIPRRGGIGGQEQRVRKIVSRRKRDRLEIQHRRDQRNAV